MKRMDTALVLIGLLLVGTRTVLGLPQSNYALQGIDVGYGEPGLPPSVTLEGKVTPFDTLEPQITLNRTSAFLNCADGSMKVNLRFREPFYGLAYADFDRNSACYVQGTGTPSVILELPLKGCGTTQDPPRVFTNNVIVRFHPGLEMEGDEVITIVCRYPPPIVPLPPERIFVPPAPIVPAQIAPLKEFEILLVICAILFLGLMLLGLGCSYYCLRQRNIQVIRKRPFSPIEEESEKLSTLESFANLKIPRVHAPSTESSSEAPPEETLASDYPSSIEDVHRPDTVSSEYSDTHAHLEVETVPPPPFKVRAPQMSVQETELVDNLTVVDREELDRQARYAKPIVVAPKPEVSVHTVDDVYLQTIVERRLIEDEERRTREVTQFYKKEQPKWDVVIRTHPMTDDEAWERGSETTDVASSIGWSTIEEPPIRPSYSVHDRDLLSRRTDVTRVDHETTSREVSRTMQRLQQDVADSRVWNEKWKVLLRVLETPPPPVVRVGESDTDYDSSETASILTEDDRQRWRQIITSESTLRSLLTQATVREDYERIRRDTRYEKLFEPSKWDVIIRVLAPPDEPQPSHRAFSDITSDGEASSSGPSRPSKPVRHFQQQRKRSVEATSGVSGTSGHSMSEMKSITDVRSMTEVMIHDFAATTSGMQYSLRHGGDRDDTSSVLSSIPGGRSVADRSQTEIIEFAPLDEGDDDDAMSMATSDVGPTLSALRQQLQARTRDPHDPLGGGPFGGDGGGFSTQEQSTTHESHVDESQEGVVRQSTVSTSRRTFASSSATQGTSSSSGGGNRLTRF